MEGTNISELVREQMKGTKEQQLQKLKQFTFPKNKEKLLELKYQLQTYSTKTEKKSFFLHKSFKIVLIIQKQMEAQEKKQMLLRVQQEQVRQIKKKSLTKAFIFFLTSVGIMFKFCQSQFDLNGKQIPLSCQNIVAGAVFISFVLALLVIFYCCLVKKRLQKMSHSLQDHRKFISPSKTKKIIQGESQQQINSMEVNQSIIHEQQELMSSSQFDCQNIQSINEHEINQKIFKEEQQSRQQGQMLQNTKKSSDYIYQTKVLAFSKVIKDQNTLLAHAEDILFAYFFILAVIILAFKADHKKDGEEISITTRDIIIGVIIAAINALFAFLYYYFWVLDSKCCWKRSPQIHPEIADL